MTTILKEGMRVRVNMHDHYFDGRHGIITSIDDGVIWDDGSRRGTIEVKLDGFTYMCRFNPEELEEENKNA